MSAKKPIKVGTRFSSLVVLSECPERDRAGGVQYLCQCDCGKTTVASGAYMRAGKWKSCGCRRHLPHRALPPGVAGFNSLFGAYQAQAKQRRHIFTLTKQQFKKLTSSDCVYCGSEPAQKSRSRADSKSKPYLYNGIDRVDNAAGYAANNCVACCGLCNRMKHMLTQEMFMDQVCKIALHDSNF